MGDYPEHDKVAAVKHETEIVDDFLAWLMTTEYTLAVPYNGEETFIGQMYVPYWPSTEQLLARWKGIDLDRLETENRQLLAEIRAGNEESPV